jgi:hypothetical protein
MVATPPDRFRLPARACKKNAAVKFALRMAAIVFILPHLPGVRRSISLSLQLVRP